MKPNLLLWRQFLLLKELRNDGKDLVILGYQELSLAGSRGDRLPHRLFGDLRTLFELHAHIDQRCYDRNPTD